MAISGDIFFNADADAKDSIANEDGSNEALGNEMILESEIDLRKLT